jgi:ABC-type dipeptide/oligopeptide/nickel transport system permease component
LPTQGDILISLIPVLFGVLLLTFVLIKLTPGDPALIIYKQHAATYIPTEEELEEIREKYGLNDPLVMQFVRWVVKTAQLDFETSTFYHRPVSELIAERAPYTVRLAIASMALALLISLPLGVLSAVWQNSFFDNISRVLAVGGSALPSFFLGLLLLYFIAYRLKLFSVVATGRPEDIILPAATLALGSAAPLTRLVRATMLEQLNQPYVTTAYAKGLRERTVIVRHALKNVLIPVITLAGMYLAHLLGGTVVVESIFSWPGIGSLALAAIFYRDYPVLRAFVIIMAVVYVLTNLVLDILIGLLDPRVVIDV